MVGEEEKVAGICSVLLDLRVGVGRGREPSGSLNDPPPVLATPFSTADREGLLANTSNQFESRGVRGGWDVRG